jgi:predicted metal-dependent hydrolase
MLRAMPGPADRDAPATVLERGRRKAYRPLPVAARHAALLDFLAAYARDEWFLAHELLEPAWMGTADPAERELYQGLIKLAAAHVHRSRGNAIGMAKNLVGARAMLAGARDAGVDDAGLDLRALDAAIEDRLNRLAMLGGGAVADVPVIVLPLRR